MTPGAQVWPPEPGAQQMQLHLDVLVDDLETASALVEEGGARRIGGHTDTDEDVRVLADPAGTRSACSCASDKRWPSARRLPGLANRARAPSRARRSHRAPAPRRRRRGGGRADRGRRARRRHGGVARSRRHRRGVDRLETGPRAGRRGGVRHRRCAGRLRDRRRVGHVPGLLPASPRRPGAPHGQAAGIGGALLDWQLARAAELHADRHPQVPATLVVGVLGTQPDLERLVARRGLEAERWYRSMERPLADLPEPRPVPGVELTPFTWGRDEEVRQAHNAAFSQHHGSSERDRSIWQSLFTGQRSFRPDLSVLALRDGRVQGYVLAYVYESDARAKGYREVVLGQIGVLREGRGQGTASAMISRALRLAADDRCARAALDVDSGNVTGALRLYEGLGFGTVRTRVSWSVVRPPVPAD